MKCSVIIFLMLIAFPVLGEMEIYRHASKSSEYDLRFTWFEKILTLALDKTIDDFGPYSFTFTSKMNKDRQLETARTHRYPNFIFLDIYSETSAREERLSYIPFPVELGMLGYRVCFHSQKNTLYIVNKIRNDQISQLRFGQGKGWIDSEILRFNGYQVIEALGYDTLFDMTAASRFDLFCRGVNEIYDEYHHHKSAKSLKIEQDIAFYYPLPNFIFTNKNNKKLIARLTQGLDMAFSDGSIDTLFQEYYGKRIAFVKLHKRRIIALDNPFLGKLDQSYTRYIYKFSP